MPLRKRIRKLHQLRESHRLFQVVFRVVRVPRVRHIRVRFALQREHRLGRNGAAHAGVADVGLELPPHVDEELEEKAGREDFTVHVHASRSVGGNLEFGFKGLKSAVEEIAAPWPTGKEYCFHAGHSDGLRGNTAKREARANGADAAYVWGEGVGGLALVMALMGYERDDADVMVMKTIMVLAAMRVGWGR